MTLKQTCIGFAALAALVSIPLFANAQEKDMKDAKVNPLKVSGKTLIAATELKWVPLPGLDGAQQALVAGDPTKEAHRVFYKFPVGLKSPMHNHSYGDRGVIVSGTLGLAVEGAPTKKLPPGSTFAIAAGIPHITTVEGPEPCVFWIEREGPFDVVVVEEAAAKKK
jgi:quercetin dioxygenase-like cupin family protein